MSDSIREKTRSGMYWSLGLKIPFEAFRFGVSIFVARILEPKDFGIVSIASMIIFYSNSLTNMGFNHALVQRKEISGKHISSVFTMDLAISCLLGTLLYLLAPLIAVFLNSAESKNVIRVMSLIFVITTLHDLPYALFRRDLDFRLITITDTTKEISISLLTLLLAILGFKYWSMVWGQLLPLSVAALFLYLKNVRKPRLSFDWLALKELMNFGGWSFVRGQIYFFSSRIDRLIVGKYLGVSTLGVYDKGKSLSQMPNESISTNINTVLFSSVSRLQDKSDELGHILRKGLLVTSAINFPIYFGLYAIAPHFVPVVLGAKWNAMIVPLQIMCLGGIFASLNGLVSVIAVGIGDYQRYTIQQIISTCALVVLCLALVRFGIEAVAGGVVVYSAGTFWMGFSLVKKKINFSWKELFTCLFPPLVCSLIMSLCIKTANVFFIEKQNLVNLSILIALGAFVYIGAIMSIPNSTLDSLKGSVIRDINKRWLRIKSTFHAFLSAH